MGESVSHDLIIPLSHSLSRGSQMAKIYEAIENARNGRKGLEVPPIPSSRPPILSAPLRSTKLNTELDMEWGSRLYQNLEALLPDTPKKIIQFIGSQEGEGTSTVVQEFARAANIKFGKRVLLLDADRNHPCQHLFFDIQPQCGWQEEVRDNGSIDKALYQIGKTGLFVSPSSQPVASDPHILNSLIIDVFLKRLRQQFDLILFDSPPATLSSDGLVLSPKVDGVILVLEAERTRWPVAENVKERITKSGGKLLGIVLNKRRFYIPEFIYRRL